MTDQPEPDEVAPDPDEVDKLMDEVEAHGAEAPLAPESGESDTCYLFCSEIGCTGTCTCPCGE